MEYPNTSIERIRDAKVPSKSGFINDLGYVLDSIKTDDLLAPKPN